MAQNVFTSVFRHIVVFIFVMDWHYQKENARFYSFLSILSSMSHTGYMLSLSGFDKVLGKLNEKLLA